MTLRNSNLKSLCWSHSDLELGRKQKSHYHVKLASNNKFKPDNVFLLQVRLSTGT